MELNASRQLELLACVLINGQFLKEVLGLDEELRERFDLFSQMWVEEVGNYFELYEDLPDLDYFKGLLGSRIGQDPDVVVQQEQAALALRALQAAREMLKLEDKAKVLDAGRKLLRAWLEKTEVQVLSAGLADADIDIKAVLEASTKRLTRITSVEAKRFSVPFENGLIFPSNNYQATGISFIDQLCGGGLCGGEVIGHSAPIGSGKTTLCLQVAWSRVQQIMAPYRGVPIEDIPFERLPRVYGFFYEMVVNLLPNFVSCAANIHRNTMEQYFTADSKMTPEERMSILSSSARRDYKEYEMASWPEGMEAEARAGRRPWPKGELERFERVAQIANKLLMLVDFSGNNVDLSDWAGDAVVGMKSFLEGHQDKENNPGVNFVLCDYVGIMCNRWQSGSKDSFVRRSDRHQLLKDAVSQMVQHIAAPYNCPVWAAHQLNSTENKREGGLAPNPMNNEGTGMFLENCAVGFASGVLARKENAAVFVHAKQRRGNLVNNFICELGRDYARWSDAGDKYHLVNGQLMNKNERADSGTRAPVANRPMARAMTPMGDFTGA